MTTKKLIKNIKIINTTPNCFNNKFAVCDIKPEKIFIQNGANVNYIFETLPNAKQSEKFGRT